MLQCLCFCKTNQFHCSLADDAWEGLFSFLSLKYVAEDDEMWWLVEWEKGHCSHNIQPYENDKVPFSSYPWFRNDQKQLLHVECLVCFTRKCREKQKWCNLPRWKDGQRWQRIMDYSKRWRVRWVERLTAAICVASILLSGSLDVKIMAEDILSMSSVN